MIFQIVTMGIKVHPEVIQRSPKLGDFDKLWSIRVEKYFFSEGQAVKSFAMKSIKSFNLKHIIVKKKDFDRFFYKKKFGWDK
jgi:hypothetical protein